MSRRLRIVLAAAAILALILAVAWIVVLPWYVRGRLIREAAARGVVLYIADVAVGFSDVVVSGAVATANDVPGVTLSIGRTDVRLKSFSPDSIEVANASFDIEGQAGVVTTALAKFLESQPRGEAGKEPRKISVQNARIEWKRAIGEGTVLHVGDFGGDIEGAPLGSAGHMHFAGVPIAIGAVSLGPWTGTLERDKEKSQIAVALAPKDPDAARLTITRASGGFSAEAKIASTMALTDLGLTKPLLALFSLENASVAIDATHSEDGDRGSGEIRHLRVEGMRLKGAPSPVSLDLTDVGYGGPLVRMPISRGRVQVGPLKGPLEGALGRPPGAATADVRTTTDVMSCADALRMETTQMLGSNVAQHLDDLSRALGVQNAVKGTVVAHVEWHADTRDVTGARLVVSPTASCDLSFLPR